VASISGQVTSLIGLYKALGGGWQPETRAESSAETE
jgi:outer membrane protein TolC